MPRKCAVSVDDQQLWKAYHAFWSGATHATENRLAFQTSGGLMDQVERLDVTIEGRTMIASIEGCAVRRPLGVVGLLLLSYPAAGDEGQIFEDDDMYITYVGIGEDGSLKPRQLVLHAYDCGVDEALDYALNKFTAP